ncbi:MAG: hypothetical protein JO247_11920 [Chloroflexi bacterium]|nr:hypothetical protein [Chloroflexota bacterium]
MRDSIHLELQGVPTVTLITTSFVKLARFTSAAAGMPDQSFLIVPHPIGGISADALRAKVRAAADDVWQQLTAWQPDSALNTSSDASPYPAPSIHVEGSVSDVQRWFFEHGLCAGLPFIPPTRDLVNELLTGTSHHPSEVIWDGVPPRMGVLTVELAAVCAAMAGCEPLHLPVLLAIIEALTDPEAHYAHQSTTTGTESLLLLVNGPIVKELGLAYGTGAAGLCFQPNAAIGYAMGLISKVVGGSRPPDHDKSTLSNPADLLNTVIGENEDSNPWKSYAVDHGFAPTDNVVTVKAVYPPLDVSDHQSTRAGELLHYIACSINQPYTYAMRHKPVVLGICPEHAETLAQDGCTKESIRDYLWRNARYPASVYAIGAWEGGGIQPSEDFPNLRFGSDERLPIVAKPEDIEIVVCGGAGKHTQFWPGPKGMVSRNVDLWR